jgi:hypothetical protein
VVNTDKLVEARTFWYTPDQQNKRYEYLKQLASEGDILDEFLAIPEIFIKGTEAREYLINVQGFAKIRELHNIGHYFETKWKTWLDEDTKPL